MTILHRTRRVNLEQELRFQYDPPQFIEGRSLNKILERTEKKLLHYTGKAIADYKMIQAGDRVMVCLSGGKDSYTLLTILRKLQQRTKHKFELMAFTLDQAQPGWDDTGLRAWLTERDIPFEIFREDTYSIVNIKSPKEKPTARFARDCDVASSIATQNVMDSTKLL